jgi:hypothetical protein
MQLLDQILRQRSIVFTSIAPATTKGHAPFSLLQNEKGDAQSRNGWTFVQRVH